MPLVPIVVGLSGLGVLTNLDVIVGKAALGAEEAGQFAAAATLAKAVFLVPQAVSFVLLPRVAARSAQARNTGVLLGVAVAVTLVAGGLASLLLGGRRAAPRDHVRVRVHWVGGILGAYAAASTLIGALSWSSSTTSAGAPTVSCGASRGSRSPSGPFAAFHDSAEAIIAVDAAVGPAGILLHELMYPGPPKRLCRACFGRCAWARRPAGGPPERRWRSPASC